MIRTHDAGTLRAGHDGEHDVTLAGWVARRRDHGGVAFVDLRDASGFVQVVCPRPATAVHATCARVLRQGRRRRRRAGPRATTTPTCRPARSRWWPTELDVLSESEPLPFPVDGDDEIDPATSRSGCAGATATSTCAAPARPARCAPARKITSIIRRVMEAHDFLDIETPYLTRSTPEGARDFLVPVRLQPGHWYALPQSPQLFKQLLMVVGPRALLPDRALLPRRGLPRRPHAGVHPARHRDELPRRGGHLRPRRGAARRAVAEVLGVELPTPFPRMTYAEAMRRFGSDRPDLRFGLELVDLAALFAGTEVRVFQAGHVGARRRSSCPAAASCTRKQLDGWQDWAKGARRQGPRLRHRRGRRRRCARRLGQVLLRGRASPRFAAASGAAAR